jgi:Pilin accessory protein (PilO)
MALRKGSRHVLTLGGRSWALGLVWQVVTTPGVNLRRRALQDARESVDNDLFCVPQTLTPCFGLGSHRQGHRPGMASAAAALARSMPGHWVGVFELPRAPGRSGDPLFWLLAVRQEGIDPRTDIVGREAEIRALFQQLIADGAPRRYAPPRWQQDGAPLDLALQLARAPRLRLWPTSLVPRFDRRSWARAAVLLAVMAVVGGGLWWRHDALREIEAQARRAARDAAPPRRAERWEPADEPWNREPTATRWAASCIDALRETLLPVPGWRWVEASCNGSRAAVTYARQDGSLALAKAWWAMRQAGRAAFRPTRADLLTIEAPMRGLTLRAPERPASRGTVAARLIDPLDAARVTVTATESPAVEPPPRPLGDGTLLRRRPGAPATQLALSGLTLPLDELAAVIARLPAATLREANLRNAGAIPAWSATAVVYVKS